MHIELLPQTAQQLVQASCQPRQDVILAYWREILDQPISELTGTAATTLAAVRDTAVPYLIIAGADPEPSYRTWLSQALPQAALTVWPTSGHFPHLAHPNRFAQCLAATVHHRNQRPAPTRR
jgi:pimeloyl-ACP methyl ester carboxylesterase